MKVVPLVLMAVLWNRCGLKPGEYQVYRIAQDEVDESADCFEPDGEDPDDADDSSTFFAGETIALFASGDGVFFLDTDSMLIEGTRDDGIFSFEGVAVDVEVFGASDATSYTTTTTVHVDLDPAGDAVSGTWVVETEGVCDGPDCAGNPDASCTQSRTFTGTRVRAYDLEYSL